MEVLEKGVKYVQNNVNGFLTGVFMTGVFIVNFDHISHLFPVLLLLAFEHVFVCWIRSLLRLLARKC